jgi:hypothetical protein
MLQSRQLVTPAFGGGHFLDMNDESFVRVLGTGRPAHAKIDPSIVVALDQCSADFAGPSRLENLSRRRHALLATQHRAQRLANGINSLKRGHGRVRPQHSQFLINDGYAIVKLLDDMQRIERAGFAR